MGKVIKLVGGSVLAVVLGILLYQVPDMDWYLPLPAFLVAPLLIGLGIVHWRNLKKEDNEPTDPVTPDATIKDQVSRKTS
jgi:hypothetical protein